METMPIPDVNALWGGGGNSSVGQFEDVQHAVAAQSVAGVKW